MNSGLEQLLNPKKIAILGASAKPGKIGNALVRNLSRSSAEIFLVNPHEDEIEGLRCYRSVADLPQNIDLAIVSLPADIATAEIMKTIDKGVPYVLVAAAGFSEIGEKGRARESEIIRYAKARGTRLVGPNALGIYSAISNIDALIIPRERSPRPKRGCIGIISQSGSVQVSIHERSSDMGLGVSYSVGLGNRSDVSEIDILEFFETDRDTRCIALYLESFRDGRKFIELAKRISLKKPIVMIKAGTTLAGEKAASSHTGALAKGSDAIVAGALRQAGIIRAFDDEELIDYSNALSLMPPPKGGRVAYVGSAGGVGVMMSDYIEGDKLSTGLKMATLSEETQQELRRILNEFSPTSNPIDLTASSTPGQYDAAIRTVLRDPSVDLLIVSIDMQPPMMDERIFDYVPGWIAFGKPIIGTSTGGGKGALNAIMKMQSLGIPSYPSLSRCAKAAMALYQRSFFVKRVM